MFRCPSFVVYKTSLIINKRVRLKISPLETKQNQTNSVNKRTVLNDFYFWKMRYQWTTKSLAVLLLQIKSFIGLKDDIWTCSWVADILVYPEMNWELISCQQSQVFVRTFWARNSYLNSGHHTNSFQHSFMLL